MTMPGREPYVPNNNPETFYSPNTQQEITFNRNNNFGFNQIPYWDGRFVTNHPPGGGYGGYAPPPQMPFYGGDRPPGSEGVENTLNGMDAAIYQNPTKSSAQDKPEGSKWLRGIFNFLIYGFCVMILAGSTIFALSNDTKKSMFGYRCYNVLTVSMKPAFDAGDMIFVKLREPEDIVPGNIVTFVPSRNSEAYLTHRVMEIIPDEDGAPFEIITRGDDNNINDPPVSVKAIIGVYQFHIPKAGGIIQFVRENLIVMSIFFGSTFLLLVFLRSYFAAKKETKTNSVTTHQDIR